MAPESADGVEAGTEDGEKVRFHFIKSPSFRTVHVDGVIGGITPHLMLSIGVYSERLPYPDQMVHQLGPDGALGGEIEALRLARDGVVRELEVSLTMSLDVARRVSEWLTKNIAMADQAIREVQEKHKSMKEGDANA